MSTLLVILKTLDVDARQKARMQTTALYAIKLDAQSSICFGSISLGLTPDQRRKYEEDTHLLQSTASSLPRFQSEHN